MLLRLHGVNRTSPSPVARSGRTGPDEAFLDLLQRLPARQRSVLILRDVFRWPADEAAALLGLTVATTERLLQRARAHAHDPAVAGGGGGGATPDADDRPVAA